MSLPFPSEQWVAAWVSACNQDLQFSAAASGWKGSIVLEILGTPAPANDLTAFRLEGADGLWTSFEIGSGRRPITGVSFSLRASYPVWKALLRQEVHPVKAIIQGRVRVTGQLSMLLRWSEALCQATRLAGDLDTVFLDEA